MKLGIAGQVTAKRPDQLALIGPEYDRPSPQPAERTLIICSAPRTGSYELCRYLLAAGIGVPHEYFNSNYARRLGERWGFVKSPLEPSDISRYIQVLRRRRAQSGVFATKLQFPHFDGCLRNEHGRQLFEGATIVHLFRPDAAAQYASYRSALESGVWDFSTRPTTTPAVRDTKHFDVLFKQALQELDSLMGQDAGFRCMFALLSIRPIFVTTDELFSDPRPIVHKIADTIQVAVNEGELDRAIELSAPYGRDREKSTAGFVEHFKRVVFRRA
jgi:LPS sulfotransferase NodH